jgi:hypothetical protein
MAAKKKTTAPAPAVDAAARLAGLLPNMDAQEKARVVTLLDRIGKSIDRRAKKDDRAEAKKTKLQEKLAKLQEALAKLA